jgi:predicted alpha/beta-fold hydrolase
MQQVMCHDLMAPRGTTTMTPEKRMVDAACHRFVRKAIWDVATTVFRPKLLHECTVDYLYDIKSNKWALPFVVRRKLSWMPRPFYAFASPFAQTLLHRVLFQCCTPVPYTSRHVAAFKDGQPCVLDVAEPVGGQPVGGQPVGGSGSGRRVLFVCHGIGGNSESCYCRKLAHEGVRRGMTVVVYNRRAHLFSNASKVKQWPLHYDRQDMDDALMAVKHLYPDTECIYGIGVSLGSNLLLRYVADSASFDADPVGHLGKIDEDVPSSASNIRASNIRALHPFCALVSVSNGFDLKHGIDAMHDVAEGMCIDYIKEVYGRCINESFNSETKKRLDDCRTLRDVDACVTRLAYGDDFDMNAYYDAASCRHVMGFINVPVLAVASKDDPFLSNVEERHRELVDANPGNTLCILTSHGGHTGLLSGISCRPWLYDVVFDFFDAVRRDSGSA